MKLNFNLNENRVLLLDKTSKAEALESLIAVLGRAPEVGNVDELRQKIFEREQLMSTGIGLGIAVPHVRLASVSNGVMALGICASAVEDYETLDDEPVRLICMIAANNEQHNEYIQTLASISKLLKQESIRKALVGSKSAKEAFEFFAKANL